MTHNKRNKKVTPRFANAVKNLRNTIVGIFGLMLAGAACGDDLTGEDEFLCASANVIVCVDNGSCASASPWEVNVPQFIIVDLQERSLSTTEASGESRMTIVDTSKRDDDRIYLQGVEGGRAYTIVVDEETGYLTAAVVRDDLTVTVFGACTPTP